MHGRRSLPLSLGVACLVALGVAPPAAMSRTQQPLSPGALQHASQPVAVRAWIARPSAAPAPLQQRFRQLRALAGSHPSPAREAVAPGAAPLNHDEIGLPQNEESVTACRGDTRRVLGGTNDYRGLLDPQQNFTGWHYSSDGGASVANEGLLPALDGIPSGGDPVDVADKACQLFAGSLNYDPVDLFPSAIGVYRSDPETLASCPGGTAGSCWPRRRIVARAPEGHFYDKEWIYAGSSGDAGNVVWVVFSDFKNTDANPAGFTAQILAVRCTADLNRCTRPIPISLNDPDVQFGDVTIGPDGSTYVTWSAIQGELEGTPQTFVHKIRVAPPGSTTFGPEHVVAVEPNAIPFGGALHANDFRVATYPKNEVVQNGGLPRVFVTWDACEFRLMDRVCEEPVIKLTHSDDSGATWSEPSLLSRGGDNYFPTISQDGAGRLAEAWYTNRYDRTFHNRQDVELASVDPQLGAATGVARITRESNEPEADPTLGGLFIGDYFEVFADRGTALTHFNANYRSVPVLGEGLPIPQQDNFLSRDPF